MISNLDNFSTDFLEKRLDVINKKIDETNKIPVLSDKELDIINLYNKEKSYIINILLNRTDSKYCETREKLEVLNSKIKELKLEVARITTHPSGKFYWEMLSDLLYELIDKRYKEISLYDKHKIYRKLRREIMGSLNVKTRSITSIEYKEALKIIEHNLNYEVNDKYR